MEIGQQQPTRRVSGSNKRQRTVVKVTRFTPAELIEIEEAASRYGLTLASFQRAAAISVARGASLSAVPARSVRRPPVEKELLAKALGQLGKIGSNLNQLAKATHTTGADSAEIDATLFEVRFAARAVMEALGRRP